MNPVIGLLAASLRLWTPLALAAMGGVVSERSGVVNIALESMLLGGAFAAVTAAHAAHDNLFVGVLAGVVVGALIGLLHAFITQVLRVSHILSGVALNLGTLGATTFLFRSLGDTAVQTTAVFPAETGVPVTLLLVALVWFTLYRTPVGLRLRACGESPPAARSAGVAVHKVRYAALATAGALAGLGGVVLAFGIGRFTENMTSGRGYIALAAVIFGRWNPLLAAGAALLFAFGDALQLTLQTRGLAGSIPPDLLTLLPYVVTLAALAFFSGRAATPAALGDTDK